MFPIRRRHFLRTGLAALGSLSVFGVTGSLFGRGFGRNPFRRSTRPIPGAILGANHSAAHLLRGHVFPRPSETLEVPIVIVGGGIAGLSASWGLDRLGFSDYLLLELEKATGGNSRSGSNPVSPYPWGAHYVPLPGPEATLVRELFEELEIITGYSGELPVYDEFFLCADPHERLLVRGTWQEGIVPNSGLSELERAEIRRFFSTMDVFRLARGSDGRPAFAIPVDRSSRDTRFTDLDRLTMAEWLSRERFEAKPLHWYVNYCCRDDYGAEMKDVSAWAGIHYFASRRGRAANADSSTVLTWPEGNAFIAGKLREKAGARVRTQSLVFNIENTERGVCVDSLNPETGVCTRVNARAAIYAGPRFAAARVLADYRAKPPAYLSDFTYSPWMVANVTVSSVPRGPGAEPAWDNVSYHSPSLGYITATHQNLSARPLKSVLTYYLPLSDEAPRAARKRALERTHAEWAELVAADLEHMHPGIRREIENIDVWLWGHGMISPKPGFIWGHSRARSREGQVFFAHSDMSGISIFEEAQYQGVRAAEAALASLSGRA